MDSGVYQPHPTISTISNAMDVSDPSNFVRLLELFDNDRNQLSRKLTSYSYCDKATRQAMRELYNDHSYTADPHGAVAYLGLKDYVHQHPETYGVFLETAHPVKFLPAVAPVVGEITMLPEQIRDLVNKEKKTISITHYEDLKTYLLYRA